MTVYKIINVRRSPFSWYITHETNDYEIAKQWLEAEKVLNDMLDEENKGKWKSYIIIEEV